MLLLAAILGLLIGTSLGLLGGGGSILTLPILVYLLGVEPKSAIATSLFVVGATSAFAAVAHARAGCVDLRAGLVFGAAAMVGAYAGGSAAHLLPVTLLLIAFGAVMLVTSLAMMRGRPASPTSPRDAAAPAKVLLLGAIVGLVAGLVGAGGGFLIVPALALAGGLAMPRAIGTSLLVIALQSFAGFAGHVGHEPIDWPLTAVITVSAILGSFGGARLGRRLSPDTLRRAFAWFTLAMAVFLLAKQLPAALFGIGWGLGGYCPGPALASLVPGALPSAVFVIAMAAGMLLHRRTEPLFQRVSQPVREPGAGVRPTTPASRCPLPETR